MFTLGKSRNLTIYCHFLALNCNAYMTFVAQVCCVMPDIKLRTPLPRHASRATDSHN